MAFFAFKALTKPHVVMAFALIVFALEQFLQTQAAFFISNGRLVNFSLLILIALAFSVSLSKGKIKSPPRTYWFALLLIGYAFSTFFWLTDNFGERGYDEWGASGPYMIFVAFLGSLLITSVKQAREVIVTALVIGTAICVGLLFLANWDSRGVVMANTGSTYLLSSVLALAGLGNYVAVIAGIIEFPKKPYWKIAKWFIVALGLALALKTGSRGQTIALLGTVLLFAPLSRGSVSLRSILTGVFALLALAICLYFVLPYVSTQRWTGEHMESAWLGRTEMAGRLIFYFANQNPVYWLTGVGAGESFDVVGFYIHTTPIEVFCEEGIFGTVLFSLIIGTPTVRFLKIVASKEKSFFKDVRVGQRNTLVIFAALFFSEFMLSCKQGSLPFEQNLLLFAIVVEALCIEIKKNDKSSPAVVGYTVAR